MLIQVDEHKIEIPKADVKYISDFSTSIETNEAGANTRISIAVTAAVVEEESE